MLEIVYCAICGKIIPPGGVDEGKRYIKDDEAVCPKCYKQIPEEDHSGRTMVVSEHMAEQPAVQESAELEPPGTPKPRTSKLVVLPTEGKGLRSPASGEQASGAATKWLLAFGSLGWLTAAALAVALVSDRTGRNASPERSEPPGATVESPRPGPVAGPVEEPAEVEAARKREQALVELKAKYAAAIDFRKANPDRYADCIARFEKTSGQSIEPELAARADAQIAEIQTAREAAAGSEFRKLTEKARGLAATGDYDAAEATLRKVSQEFGDVLKPRLAAERAALEKQAAARLAPVVTAVEKLSRASQPQKGIVELEKLKGFKCAALAPRIEVLRKRLEREIQNAGKSVQKRRKAQAEKLCGQILSRFEALAFKGAFSGAAGYLKEEREKLDVETLKLMPAEFGELGNVARELLKRQAERRQALGKLAGRKVELQLADGGKREGLIVKADPSAIGLRVRFKLGDAWKEKKLSLQVADLKPGELDRLLAAAKPTGGSARLAAAIAAIGSGNFSEAAGLLRGLKGNKLAVRWATRLAAMRILRFFKGKVVKFDPKTLDIELRYDFQDEKQSGDWAGAGIRGGKLYLRSRGRWHHAKSIVDFKVSLKAKSTGLVDYGIGPVGFYNSDKRRGPVIWHLPKAKAEVDLRKERAISVTKAGARCVLAVDGKQIWDVSSEKHVLRRNDKSLSVFSVFVFQRSTGELELDDVHIIGRLDRAWYNRTMR